MLTSATIQQIGNAIADRFQPEKIILFGSYARGEAHSHSDLDHSFYLMNAETKYRVLVS